MKYLYERDSKYFTEGKNNQYNEQMREVLPRISQMPSWLIFLITRFDSNDSSRCSNILADSYLTLKISSPISMLVRSPTQLGTVRSHLQLYIISIVEHWSSILLIILYRVVYHYFYIILKTRTIYQASHIDPPISYSFYHSIRTIDDLLTNTQEVVKMVRNHLD